MQRMLIYTESHSQVCSLPHQQPFGHMSLGSKCAQENICAFVKFTLIRFFFVLLPFLWVFVFQDISTSRSYITYFLLIALKRFLHFQHLRAPTSQFQRDYINVECIRDKSLVLTFSACNALWGESTFFVKDAINRNFRRPFAFLL